MIYDLLIATLRKQFGRRLKTAVLFGSRARGDGRKDSDHDIFVVIEGLSKNPLKRQREIRGAIFDVLAELPDGINLASKTPEELDANLTPMILDVMVDGICLHGKAFLEPYRRKALAALEASGFKRLKVGTSLYFMAPQGVGRHWELNWDGYHEYS